MRKVNEPPPEAPGPAWYTVVTTTHDEVVTPYRSQALAGDRATNVILQDKCPSDPFEHVTIVGDPVAIQWTRQRGARAATPLPAPAARAPDLRAGTLASPCPRGSSAARAAGSASLRRRRLPPSAPAPRAPSGPPQPPGGGVAVTARRYRLR